MATLAGSTIASTYTYLLKMDGTSGVTSSLVKVEDGDATDTALSVSTTAISVDATDKIYLDAGSDTYLQESSADVLDVYVGNLNILKLTESTTGTTAITGDVTIDNPTTSSSTQGGKLTLFSDDGAVMASGHRLGVIEFAGAEDTSNTITVGARIEALTDATWSASENGADMVFYTTNGNASQSEVLRLDADKVATFASTVTLGTQTNGKYALQTNYQRFGGHGTNICDITNNLYWSGSAWINDDANDDSFLYRMQDEVGFVWYAGIAPAAEDSPSELMRLNTGGNLGIGDDDPSEAKLSIANVLAGDSSISIDHDIDTNVISVDSENQGNHGIAMVCDALTTGSVARFYSDSNSGGTRHLLHVINDNASASGTSCITIQQDGANKALYIDQNANGNAIYITSDATSYHCLVLDDILVTTGMGMTIGANALTTGNVANFSSNSSNSDNRQLVKITNDHTSATDAMCLYTKQDANHIVTEFSATDASYTSYLLYLNAYGRSSSDAFGFLKTFTDGDNDAQHYLQGDGVTKADGAYDGGGADYSEYFESKDGKSIAVGTTVKLDGDKVVACGEGETPMGVVRPYGNSVVVGNSQPLRWQGKYLKDDYGSYVMEEYTVTEWIEETDEVQTEAVEAKDAVLYKEGDAETKDILYNLGQIDIPEGKKVGDVKEAASKKVGDVKEEAVEGKAAIYVTKDINIIPKRFLRMLLFQAMQQLNQLNMMEQS